MVWFAVCVSALADSSVIEVIDQEGMVRGIKEMRSKGIVEILGVVSAWANPQLTPVDVPNPPIMGVRTEVGLEFKDVTPGLWQLNASSSVLKRVRIRSSEP